MGRPVGVKAKNVRRGARLAEKHTLAELSDMVVGAQGDEGEALAWAITVKLAEKRAAEGNPVPTTGYSGRMSKRRR